MLQAKRQSIENKAMEQVKQGKLTTKTAKEFYALDPELQSFAEKVHQHTEAVKKNVEDLQKLQPRKAELAEQTEIEILNIETSTEAVKDLTSQIKMWYALSFASMIIGFFMMLSGFQLWYNKIQVHQDAILRKQAGDLEERTNKTA